MRLLFLRGYSDKTRVDWIPVPLHYCDDMWTHLAYHLCKGGYGEVWYERRERSVKYDDNFVERWVPSSEAAAADFNPDVLFARGGFPYQSAVARKVPGALRVYYGAGARVVLKPGKPWDLVLVDTPSQLERARANGYDAELLIKPAAETIFQSSYSSPPPKYDFIYVANWNPNANKGHKFLLSATKGFRVLLIGEYLTSWSIPYPHVEFKGRIERISIPAWYGLAKAALICTSGKDSCPRVVPEALCCNCPILVGQSTNLWFDKYVTPQTGLTFTKENFRTQAEKILRNYTSYTPQAYYEQELSLAVSSRRLLEMFAARRKGGGA